MGYSCSAKADDVKDAMIVQLKASGDEMSSSNGWESKGQKYILEIGRENADGAITGTVHRWDGSMNALALVGESACQPVGSVRIEPSGLISRFPTSTKTHREAAMTAGLIRFHERTRTGWNDDKLLRSLIGDANFVAV